MMAVVATGGGLVFAGDVAGVFRALDAKTGEVRWQTQLPGAISGIPISYGAGGKQFVAVATGGSPEAGGLAHRAVGLERRHVQRRHQLLAQHRPHHLADRPRRLCSEE